MLSKESVTNFSHFRFKICFFLLEGKVEKGGGAWNSSPLIKYVTGMMQWTKTLRYNGHGRKDRG